MFLHAVGHSEGPSLICLTLRKTVVVNVAVVVNVVVVVNVIVVVVGTVIVGVVEVGVGVDVDVLFDELKLAQNGYSYFR